MMKKKVVFILSSFRTGGAERVFWLLCQAFDKSKFDVLVVLLDTRCIDFPTNLPDVTVVDLKTVKASYSFMALISFLRKEKPFAVYSTGGHINLLVSLVSNFCSIPFIIARGTNIPEERNKYASIKSKFFLRVGTLAFRNFDFIVCQSREMFNSWASRSLLDRRKLIIIPNPILKPSVLRNVDALEDKKKIIIVARLASVKGHDRLIEIFNRLPDNFFLTIAGGDGGAKKDVVDKIDSLKLNHRITLVGQITDVCKMISEHTLLVLSSYTEGFPNVILEALSVGTPVVTFSVGGVSEFIVNDFNGYVVEQGNTDQFMNCIVKASNRLWDHQAIAKDIIDRYSIEKVAKQYEQLIDN